MKIAGVQRAGGGRDSPLKSSSSWLGEGDHRRWWRGTLVRSRPRRFGAGRPTTREMGPALLPTPLSPTRGLARRRELGIRCFPIDPPKRTSGSVTGARTGIRIYPPDAPFRFAKSRSPSDFLPGPSFNGRFRDRAFHWPAPRTVALLRSEDLRSASSAPGRLARPVLELRRVSVTDLTLRRTEVLCTEASRPARTGSATSSRFEILLVFQAVKLSRPEGFRSVPMT